MGKTFLNILKIILCVIIITYAESYFFDLLAMAGISIKAVSSLTKEIFIVILYIVILVGVYFLYRDDLDNDFHRFKRNWFPNILMSIVFFAIITIVVWVSSYLCEVTADSFGITYTGLKYIDIFNRKFDLEVLFIIIKSIIVIPVVKCIIFVLGINNLCNSRKAGIFCSGLVGALVFALTISGSFLDIFFNAIPYFVLYFSLAYIYRKNNNNIWYSLISVILYALLASSLLAKIT